jgi:hypothetical protein
MELEALDAGSTALVVGSEAERRAFCLRRLATAERAAAAVLPSDPAGTVDAYDRAGGGAPLTVVLDGAVEGGTVATDGRDVRTVEVDAASLPAVGEATLGTIEADGSTAPADRLWLAGLPGLLERASVQQVYRLLYILSEHVRRVDGLALYALDRSVEPKTARILRQPLDYEVSLETGADPAIRTLPGRAGDA